MIHIDEQALQEKYIAEGVELGLSREDSEDFVIKLWPQIEIGEELNGVVDFRITPTPFANLASCCIGADANYKFTQEDGLSIRVRYSSTFAAL